MRTRLGAAVFVAAQLLFQLAATADPIPEVRFVEATKDVLIGDQVTFCLTFDNVGDAEGFGPFIDLVLPSHGADGPPNCDGITYVSAEVTGISPHVPLTPAAPTPIAPCGPGGLIPHPFASSGVPPVNVGPGNQLVTLPLPFGSFDESQPKLTVRVTVQVSPLADDNVPLNVVARGGFRFGKDPLDNNPLDPPILEATWPPPMVIKPHVLLMTKTFKGGENEIVPGPSFADAFEITLDVAPGQTINGLVLRDCATAGTIFTSVTSVPPPLSAPALGPPQCFTIAYPPLTGAPGIDATITANFFVGPAFPVAPPICKNPLRNRIDVQNGTWVPQDPRDQGSGNPAIPLAPLSSGVVIDVKAIAIRKTATPPSGGAIPGSLIQYRLDIRVSDYLRFGNIVVDDTLSDGQAFITPARLTVSDGFGSRTNVVIPAAVISTNAKATYRCPPAAADCGPPVAVAPTTLPGGRKIRFNVSALINWNNGILSGGLATTPPTNVPATASIVFRVRVAQMFANGPHSALDDRFVDKDDPLFNFASVEARQFASAPILNPPATGHSCADDTTTCLSVPGDDIQKFVVAKQGQYFTSIPSPLSPPLFLHGETITFRYTKTIPSGDAEQVKIEDWFPLPALHVPASINFPTPCGSSPPSLNAACLTISPTPVWTAGSPTATVTPSTNGIIFDLGSFQSTSTPLNVTVEVTLAVTNDPMADELLLTNEARECEANSYGATICKTAIAQFQVLEPSLNIYKGILCSSGRCPKTPPDPDPDLDINQPPQTDLTTLVAPAVACNPPIPCPRITGTVNSSNVAAFTGTSTSLADAGDVVTFVIAIENEGHSDAWDIVLQDILGPNLTLVPNTVCIRRGDGTPIANGGTFPALTFAGPLAAHSATSGQNIIVITFDAKIGPPSQVVIGSCLTNRVELKSYSNMPAGQNFVTAGYTPPFFDDVSVCVKPKEVSKRLLRTSEAHTIGIPVTIGEIVRYELMVQVPEGNAGSFQISDPLQPDLVVLATPPPTVWTSGASSLTYNFSWTPNVVFTFANLINADNDPGCERLFIAFNALVQNTAQNNQGDVKPNKFDVLVNNNVIATSPTVNVTIVEPKLAITKTASVQGSLATFTITVTNASPTTAFDVEVKDVLGACLQNLSIVSAVASGGASSPLIGNPVKIAAMPPGSSVVITVRATVACRKCETLDNTATVTWTSLPVNGTLVNPTGGVTPGPKGQINGERDGVSGGVNDYSASATAKLCGRVCGTKFHDKNGNRIQDAGEPGLPGWTITATDANGNVVASATTGANGAYCLDLLPGTYRICETPQPKWVQTFPNPACHTVSVTTGANVNAIDFGNRECFGRVCGRKTMPGPATLIPLAGWTIVATPQNPPGPPITAVTDANGQYCLDLPGPGTYLVTEMQQTGWTQIFPSSPYKVVVECVPPTGAAIVSGGVNANALDFRNRKLP